jgi:hypothetical protein
VFIKLQDAVFVPLSDGMEHIFDIVKKINSPVKAVDFSQDYEFADFDKNENVITKNAKFFDIIFVGGKKKHQKLVQSLSNKYPEIVGVWTRGKDGSIGFFGRITFCDFTILRKIRLYSQVVECFQAGFIAS